MKLKNIGGNNMAITNKPGPNEPIRGPLNFEGGRDYEDDTVKDVSFFEDATNSSGADENIDENLRTRVISGNNFANYEEESEYSPLDISGTAKRGKWFALGAAATAIVAAISYGMGSKGNDGKFTDEYGRKVRVIEVEEPPTTLPPLVAKDQDFRPEAERTFEFTPVYATDGPTKEVLDKLFSNFDKAMSQRNPKYLEYYYRNMNSELALDVASKVELLDNYYPAKTDYKIISDYHKLDNAWQIRIEKRFNNGEPHVRDLELILKQFHIPSNSGGNGPTTISAWTVDAEYIVTFDK